MQAVCRGLPTKQQIRLRGQRLSHSRVVSPSGVALSIRQINSPPIPLFLHYHHHVFHNHPNHAGRGATPRTAGAQTQNPVLCVIFLGTLVHCCSLSLAMLHMFAIRSFANAILFSTPQSAKSFSSFSSPGRVTKVVIIHIKAHNSTTFDLFILGTSYYDSSS